MTTTTVTTPLVVTMLKHLVAGRDLDFVADATKTTRDDALDVVSKYGYPQVDRMQWAIDTLIANRDKIPQRPGPVIGKPQVLLDDIKPTKPYQSAPSGAVNHIPPATADLLRLAEQSPFIRTQNMGKKIAGLFADLKARLDDEQAASEAKARAAHEEALVASRIATLQAEIDKLKRKPAKTTKAAAPRSQRPTKGEHPCTTPGCDRTFDTIQGLTMHQRRAHEGYDPHAVAS